MPGDKVEEVFEVAMSPEGIRVAVQAPGFRKLSPRPIHPKADPQKRDEFRSDFKGKAEEALAEGASLESVDAWFRDEARTGRKGMPARVWARRGGRPRIPRDRRYGNCCLFSGIRLEDGAAVGRACDRASTDEMNRHLLDIGAAAAEGRHAPAVLDGAGRRRSRALEIPPGASLPRLPPCSPELNPAETVFQFLKSRHFASQVFDSAEAVKEKVEAVWTDFAGASDRIRSPGTRSWATLADGTYAGQATVRNSGSVG